MALGDPHGGCLVGVLLAPVFFLLAPFALATDAALAGARSARIRRVLALQVGTCGSGHPVALRGLWSCETCKLTYTGHGFYCPHCGAFPAAVGCACGNVCRSPLWEPE